MNRIACVPLSPVTGEASDVKNCIRLIDRAAEQSDLIVLPMSGGGWPWK